MTAHTPAPCDALHVQAASLWRAGRQVLHSLTLRVPAGQHLAVVGPNGSGKSSLLQLLCGQLAPQAGQVRLFGQNLAQLPPSQRAMQLAVLHQDEPPASPLRLRDYVALGRIPHGDDRCAASDHPAVSTAIQSLGLSALASQRMGQLSGGQRRLAGLARALAQSPRVLLLDEPTNHLDIRTRADMLSHVRTLGITVVTVLHELTLAARFADRVLVLHQGHAVGDGPPDQALAPERVRQVFRMDVHCVSLPGREPSTALVFEPPAHAQPFADLPWEHTA